jgi:hypothetical protein
MINHIFTFKKGIATNVVAIVNNKQYSANSTHPNWDKILAAIREGNAALLARVIDIKNAITDYTQGKVNIVGNEVFYGTTRINGPVVDRVLDFLNNNLPVGPLLKFIDKLYGNPSSRAVKELYNFLQHKNLPITSDGNFQAYKGLSANFYSIHAGSLVLLHGTTDSDGHIYNGVGETIECERNAVDDNKDRICSYGLHAGSLEYARNYARGKLVIVEINPAHVIAIPTDYEAQKLRTCKYKVVAEYTHDLDSVYVETQAPQTETPREVETESDYSDVQKIMDENEGDPVGFARKTLERCIIETLGLKDAGVSTPTAPEPTTPQVQTNFHAKSDPSVNRKSPASGYSGGRLKFEYPTSTGKYTERNVAVTESDNTYIKGYDLNDNNQFKCFRKDKIRQYVTPPAVKSTPKRDKFGRFVK